MWGYGSDKWSYFRGAWGRKTFWKLFCCRSHVRRDLQEDSVVLKWTWGAFLLVLWREPTWRTGLSAGTLLNATEPRTAPAEPRPRGSSRQLQRSFATNSAWKDPGIGNKESLATKWHFFFLFKCQKWMSFFNRRDPESFEGKDPSCTF